jgi:hypothetical protein
MVASFVMRVFNEYYLQTYYLMLCVLMALTIALERLEHQSRGPAGRNEQ